MSYLAAGEIVPDFTLQDQHNSPVKLSNLLQQGQVLVYFYPKAMTPGCTVQACALRDVKADLTAKGITIIGISTDAPAKLAKFTQRDELNFTLLSDEDHKVADTFGVWGEKKFMGKVYDGLHRISFLINQDSTVAKVFDNFKTKDHHQVVLDYLS